MEKETITQLLNDLIMINNDRILGYDKAIANTKELDIDLKAVYQQMANQSKNMVAELSIEVEKKGGSIETDTTLSGKVYRIWMDVKATFSGHDRASSLDACEFGEAAIERAYQTALQADVEILADLRKLIMAQHATLKASHDIIRTYLNLNKAVA